MDIRNMAKQNLTVREKLGFGLGDTASNIVYQAVINILLYFYTDVYGIEAAAAGTLMLVVRAVRCGHRSGDGCTGRPYPLASRSLPSVDAVGWRCPTARWRWQRSSRPMSSVGTKLVYAYISYALLMTAYTAVNVPYSALGGVMTGDSEERGNLQTWRFAMAMVGGFLVTSVDLPAGEAPGWRRFAGGLPARLSLRSDGDGHHRRGLFPAVLPSHEGARVPDRPSSKRSAMDDLGAMLTNRSGSSSRSRRSSS